MHAACAHCAHEESRVCVCVCDFCAAEISHSICDLCAVHIFRKLHKKPASKMKTMRRETKDFNYDVFFSLLFIHFVVRKTGYVVTLSYVRRANNVRYLQLENLIFVRFLLSDFMVNAPQHPKRKWSKTLLLLRSSCFCSRFHREIDLIHFFFFLHFIIIFSLNATPFVRRKMRNVEWFGVDLFHFILFWFRRECVSVFGSKLWILFSFALNVSGAEVCNWKTLNNRRLYDWLQMCTCPIEPFAKVDKLNTWRIETNASAGAAAAQHPAMIEIYNLQFYFRFEFVRKHKKKIT